MNIELKNLDYALNPFNENLISDELDKYITNESYKQKDKINITIYGSLTKEEQNKLENTIHNYYNNLYKIYKNIDKFDNYIRFIALIIGIVLILISEQLTFLFSELFLIAGWVLIWEMLYDILFNEIKRKRKSKTYKALSICQITFN